MGEPAVLEIHRIGRHDLRHHCFDESRISVVQISLKLITAKHAITVGVILGVVINMLEKGPIIF